MLSMSEPFNSFHYDDLSIDLHPEVYEPAEDTFGLSESIILPKKASVLELGAGCGLISLVCAQRGASVVCTDINPHAVRLIQRNYEKNRSKIKGSFEVRKGNLFDPIGENETFDVIIFNPPYLPTTKKERVGGWFDVAIDGGADGLAVTKRFITEVSTYLKTAGSAYFIFSSLSPKKQLDKYLFSSKQLYEIVQSRWYHDERLDVYRLYSLHPHKMSDEGERMGKTF